jgi:hypothetical protein
MSSAEDENEAGLKRLAEYWFRANIMHDHLHKILQVHGDMDALEKAGLEWEFLTYLAHWLSALFVVVEGFNKLKLKDAQVQRLFKAHIRYLKAMRHETYHFTIEKKQDAGEAISQLNWAEELHSSIGEHVGAYIRRGAIKDEAKRFIDWRLRHNAPSAL